MENELFTKTVSFLIAKLLNNSVYGDNKYAAEDLKVTFDNFLGSSEIKKGELIVDGDNIHGKYYLAPTYAEVIDWLFQEKKIVIKLTPCFTYALESRVAYYYEVYRVNEDEGKLELLFCDDTWMSSFVFAMDEIIRKLIKDYKI